MSDFFATAGAAALAELGDKTQLLAVLMTATFRKPLPIVLGFLLSTVLNHAIVAALTGWAILTFEPTTLRWAVGLTFLATVVWLLIPDKPEEARHELAPGVVFFAALLTFFVAEIGDKSQIAAAWVMHQAPQGVPALMSTTAGMMVALVPAIVLGGQDSMPDPSRHLHRFGAMTFGLAGVLVLTSSKLPL